MEKKLPKTTSLERKLANSPQLEVILTTLKSLLSLSQIGSVFSVLLSEYIPSRRMLRLETFTNELADEFKKIEDKIDPEFITSDEFAFLFEQCYKAASENYEKEKLNAFKAIIINSSFDKSVINSEKEFFFNLTRQLTTLHIQMLFFLSDTRGYINKMNLNENQIQGGYKEFMPTIFPKIDYETIKIIIDDLNKYGLTTLKSQVFSTITASSGLRLLGDRHTTTFGDKYLSFINI